MDQKQKILSLLGSGIDAGQVASAVGVTPSYISQLLADPDFALLVAEKRTLELTQAKSIDEKWDNFEERLLEKLNDLIPFFSSPRHILDALKLANMAKRKTALNTSQSSGSMNKTYVTINVPRIIIQQYKIDMAGGMVEVAGRSLQPMSSNLLLQTLKARNGGSDGKEPKLLAGAAQESPRKTNEISVDSI